jgi:deoxyadenosine/deoxycytidine kinase
MEITGFIYLQTDPETCFNRIVSRNRTGEENITNGYLENCHEYHQRWLQNNNSFILNVDKYTESVVIKITNYILQFIR